MLSAAKLTAAGVVILVAGTLLSAGRPLIPSANALQGAERGDLGRAAYVHGGLSPRTCCGDSEETFDADGDRLTLRGMVETGRIDMDDPRMDGDFTWTVNLDEFPQPGTTERVEVHWGEFTIVNEDGAWRGTYSSTYDLSRGHLNDELVLYQLVGEGAYEGLSALLAWTGLGDSAPNILAGAIFPGPLPPR